ncbi:MAG: glucose/quinate/shikimate family membrane-bound PQQ-dependent dehydrogenase [Alphaproteobacteria bacterium]
MFKAISVFLFGVLGLAIAGLGGWLVSLGGSPAYLAIGLALLATAWLIARNNAAALTVYAVTLVLALAWAVWEVGFDWWQLAPRGGLLVLLGIWLWLPPVRRGLQTSDGKRAPGALLALSVLATVAIAVYAMFQDPSRRDGSLNTAAVEGGGATGADFADGDWHQYGRTNYGQRYSPLTQITPENVASLQTAWTFQTGDVKQPGDIGETTYQVTPIKVDGTLYICTPHNMAIALDAVTGIEKWRFDANSGLNPSRQHQTCRGVTYWKSPAGAAGDVCHERVFMPTADARLISIDALTGKPCTAFGTDGAIRLDAGMPYPVPGWYYSTSPPIAVAGKLIIGGAVNDNYSTQAPSGVIRAFDIDTGALIWNWDSAKPEKTAPIDIAGGETYTNNSPNSWSLFSVDEKLGLVYLPMGNQTPDQLGMGRSANVEKYATGIVALDIETGADRWVQQFTHHDLWDMDVPAQPILVDLTQADGSVLPALVAPTKQGDIFVLNRATGAPILPVTEEPAPTGTIPEDFSSPTQPASKLTFNPPPLREADMWGATILDQVMCRINFHRLNYGGRYTPPSVRGSIIHPGNFGVFNWGSVAVDPVRQVMFGMPTYLPFTSRLVPAADIPPPDADSKGSEQGLNRNDGAPYGVFLGPFLGPLGVPCSAPPWGFVAGADLRTGEVVYRHKNGTVRDMTPLPLPFELGVPGIGGPIITAGGVTFLAAAVDNYLRAYDLTTGDKLWQVRLPAGGQSTPMTYAVDGQQYVVIVAGGHGSVGTKPGDYVMAFTLPKS